jgi:hypothetical protein
MDNSGTNSFSTFLRSRTGIVLLGFLSVAAFFLLTEHTAHVFGVLPWLFLLACPLMHVFMHVVTAAIRGTAMKVLGASHE